MKRKITIFDCINFLILSAVLFITIYPLWYVLCISLSSTEMINSGTVTLYPKGFNFAAYKQIFGTSKILRAYSNSVVYTAVGTLCCMAMTIIFVYPLSRKNFVLRKPITVLITITLYFTGGLIPTFLVVQGTGLLDSMWSLIIPNIIWTFDAILLRNFFEGVPAELHEAAIIDGANELRILTKIYIPLSTSAIATIALFYAMGQWNSYLLPSIYITSYEKLPLPVILRDMLMEDTNSNPNSIASNQITPEALKNATMFVSILPFLIFYPYLQKYFVKGLTMGAVKG